MKISQYENASNIQRMEKLIEDNGIELEEEIEYIIGALCKHGLWFSIDGTSLLYGYTLAGGIIKCRECECVWSLNYYYIEVPSTYDEETANTIIKIWQDSKTWYQCPCCSYQSMRKG